MGNVSTSGPLKGHNLHFVLGILASAGSEYFTPLTLWLLLSSASLPHLLNFGAVGSWGSLPFTKHEYSSALKCGIVHNRGKDCNEVLDRPEFFIITPYQPTFCSAFSSATIFLSPSFLSVLLLFSIKQSSISETVSFFLRFLSSDMLV